MSVQNGSRPECNSNLEELILEYGLIETGIRKEDLSPADLESGVKITKQLAHEYDLSLQAVGGTASTKGKKPCEMHMVEREYAAELGGPAWKQVFTTMKNRTYVPSVLEHAESHEMFQETQRVLTEDIKTKNEISMKLKMKLKQLESRAVELDFRKTITVERFIALLKETENASYESGKEILVRLIHIHNQVLILLRSFTKDYQPLMLRRKAAVFSFDIHDIEWHTKHCSKLCEQVGDHDIRIFLEYGQEQKYSELVQNAFFEYLATGTSPLDIEDCDSVPGQYFMKSLWKQLEDNRETSPKATRTPSSSSTGNLSEDEATCREPQEYLPPSADSPPPAPLGNPFQSQIAEIDRTSRLVAPNSNFLLSQATAGIDLVAHAVLDKSSNIESPSSFDSMSAHTIISPLPVLPSGWAAEKDFKILGSLSQATQRSIEPVGPHFLAHARRARHKRTFSEDDRIQAQNAVKKVEDDDAGEISEAEDSMLLAREAKDWKSQDHYAVLGLSKYRYKATEDQIKRAHRKKVLKHHPDKKAAAGSTEDDNFFKCIQKATEVLMDPVKRRQFDSVDERADVEPPTKKQASGANFYKLWSKVFKAEGRFSKTQPVPKFGDEKSSQEEVETFYNFFYNFDSWRSFEYQDEDVPDDNENRDQKRHMERKNNNARKKKKTEDSARLRKLLDDCSTADERIKKFRQAANASKNKKKLDKEAAEKKAAEEAKAKKEADEKAKKEAEDAAKIERESSKKAKEAAKNAVKKNKRVLKGSVKDANYFAVSGEPSAGQIDAVLGDVELIQGKIDADEIAALAGKLNGLKVSEEIKGVWTEEAKRLVAAGKLKDGELKTLS